MTKIKKDRNIIFCIGKQRRGKSHLAKEALIPAMPPPVIVLDSEGEYNGLVYESVNKFFQSLIESGEVPEDRPNVVRIWSKTDASRLFMWARKIRRPLSVVVEECDKYCSPHKIDEWFGKLIDYGGHHDVNILCLARRFSKVHNDIESQADFRISFQQDFPGDVKRVAQYTENADVVKNLERRQFICFGEIRGPYKKAGFEEGKILTLNDNKITEVKK